jgi:hypothetical protein
LLPCNSSIISYAFSIITRFCLLRNSLAKGIWHQKGFRPSWGLMSLWVFGASAALL